MNSYWLSEQMQRYIVSKDKKYIVGKTILNPILAKPITTREGSTRADTSTYICYELPDNCEIVAGEDGLPMILEDENDLP